MNYYFHSKELKFHLLNLLLRILFYLQNEATNIFSTEGVGENTFHNNFFILRRDPNFYWVKELYMLPKMYLSKLKVHFMKANYSNLLEFNKKKINKKNKH